MLKRICVGLLICHLANGALPAAATPSDADSIRSMHAMALQSSARGDIDNALTTFDSAIRLAERTYGKDSSYVADLCYDAGVAALHENRWTKAQDFLSKAVQINPNSKQARIELAAYYHKRGQCADAKQQLQKVLAHDPTNLEARQLMALTYQKEGNPGKATSELYKLQAAAAGQPVAAESEPPPETTAPVTAMLPTTPPVAPPEAAAAPNPLASLLHNITPAKPAGKPAPKPIKPKERPLNKKQLQAQRRAEQRAEAQRKAAEQRKSAEARKAAKNKKHAAPPQDESASAFNTPARLHSKAVLLTPVNKHAASSESSASEAAAPEPKKPAHVVETRDDGGPEEEGFGGTPIRKPRKQAPAPVATPPVQPMVPVVPKIEAPKRPRAGLVPPPPPVVPQFGIPPFMPPPPQPKPVAPPVVKKPVVREVVDENAKPTDEDAEFLLDWAGKKKKKK